MKARLLILLMPLVRGLASKVVSGITWGVGYFISEKLWKKKDKK